VNIIYGREKMNKIAATLSFAFLLCIMWKQPVSAQSDTPVVSTTLTVEAGARQAFEGIGCGTLERADWLYMPLKTRDAISKFLFGDCKIRILRHHACWKWGGHDIGCSVSGDPTCSQTQLPILMDMDSLAKKYNKDFVLMVSNPGMDPNGQEDILNWSRLNAEMIRLFNQALSKPGCVPVSVMSMSDEPDVNGQMGPNLAGEITRWFHYYFSTDTTHFLDSVKLLGFELSSSVSAPGYFNTVIADSVALKSITCFATHSYNESITEEVGDIVAPYILDPDTVARWGQKKYWMTESSDYGAEDFRNATVATNNISRFLADMNRLCSAWIHYLGATLANSQWQEILGGDGNQADLLLHREEEQDWRPLLKCYYIMQANRTFDLQCRFRKSHTSLYHPGPSGFNDNCHCCSDPGYPYCRQEDSTMVSPFGQKPSIYIAAGINPYGSWAIGLSDYTGNVDSKPWESVRGPTAFACTIHVEELVNSGDIVFKKTICNADSAPYSSADTTPFIHDLGSVTMHNGDMVTTIRPMTFQTFRSPAHVSAAVPRRASAASAVQKLLNIANGAGRNLPVIIRFTVSGGAPANSVRIAIYNMRGSLIRELFSGKKPLGENRVAWDGLGPDGKPLANGSYLVNLDIGAAMQSRSVILAR
jgi:hypothetical protein